ncbi:MAG: glycine cleavage system aminomethyltransferase GcvT [Limisphaerales bacterium]
MLKRTPLFEAHRRLGARLVEFGGWEMPVQYTGILDEHKAVRTAAGAFDISHMGEVFVRGTAAEDFLGRALTNDVRKLEVGQGQYTLLCNLAGGVIDDLLVYRIGSLEYLLILNASRVAADVAWLSARLAEFGGQRDAVALDDASERLAAVAVQGPRVAEFIDAVIPGPAGVPGESPVPQPSALKRNSIAAFGWNGTPVWFARTGYTGEDGFEIVAPNEVVGGVWERLVEKGAAFGLKPCGLGARDTLRMEMCFPLYGHELTEETTPVEAGLGIFVGWDKPDFCGREVLSAQRAAGVKRKLIAFRMVEAGSPPLRGHYPVWANTEGEGGPLGHTTSGTLSPSLGVGIGLAYVPVEAANPGTRLMIEVRGRRYPAEVVKKPLYRRPSVAAAS